MKTYNNGVSGPNLEKCDIITFDLKDATLQFCLPEASEDSDCLLASQESLDNWHSTVKLKLLAENEWEYTIKDGTDERPVASVSMDMKLINLELDELESWLGTKSFCLLKKNELSRLAIEYFVKSTEDLSQKLHSEISVEENFKNYRLFTTPENLWVSKQDLLPWYTNKRERIDNNGSSLIQTFIPISERAVIFFLFEITRLKRGDSPFFFSHEECQTFGDMLREEFLSYVKITYSPEIQAKIKSYAQQP